MELEGCLADEALMRHNGHAAEAAVALTAVVSKQEPIAGRKVYSLADGEAVGKPAMVGAREGHHKLSRPLHCPTHWHACKTISHERRGRCMHCKTLQNKPWVRRPRWRAGTSTQTLQAAALSGTGARLQYSVPAVLSLLHEPRDIHEAI